MHAEREASEQVFRMSLEGTEAHWQGRKGARHHPVYDADTTN